MKRLLNILVIDSIRELIRYKSFFLLVALLILLDRLLRHYSAKIQFQFDQGNLLDYQWLAIWTYETLPGEMMGMFLNWKLWAVAMGLFFFKQLTSMWPSSDMRLMHRKEGGTFRIFNSLRSIQGAQILWDALAISTVGVIGLIWSGTGYLMGWWNWYEWRHPAALLPPLLMAGIFWPVGMAGFSYSSKLAVLRRSGFAEKRRLFFCLFLKPRVRLMSWIFFLFRILISLIFVLIVPIGVLLSVENLPLRILLASLSAAPAYSYVKMATFKFFLEVYRPYPEIRREYPEYFEALPN